MKMKKNITTVSIIAVYLWVFSFSICAFANGVSSHNKEESAPTVNIVSPANNGAHAWNTLINYNVVVTYDGKSTKYNEIPSNKIIMKTAYVPDVSAINGNKSTNATSIPTGVVEISRSNCLGCHDFKLRATGPSFQAINKRYTDTSANAKLLVQHIKNGSAGAWGSTNMPPHPNLSDSEITTMVHWILERANNPDINYYVGTDGAFRMSAPKNPSSKAGLILTANFTASTPKRQHQPIAQGEDIIILRGKPAQ